MIIYGTNSVHLKSEQSERTTCPSCETKGSLVFSVFRKHFHIFWIPLFPIGKRGGSQCQHCGNVLEPKAMPQDVKTEYNYLKDSASGPIWQFAGLGIITILIAWAAYSNNQNEKLELAYISAPQTGDVYQYEIESGSYSSLKVVSISDDSIYFLANEYEINTRTQVNTIDKPENYSKAAYAISKEKLEEMYDSGEIFEINR